jgi:3-(3-hydroxy-phenyl)propionate hydroxylase
MADERVLVAGAGPVGLVVANRLADAGIYVTVFEAEPELPRNLRASTFQPPTLDMLQSFGASRKLIEMGLVAPRLQYRDRNGWRADFDFGLLANHTRHPYRLQCEQFKLNEVLTERLQQSSYGSIEFGSPVTGVEQDHRGVTITVESSGGRRAVRGSWLVGADGGRSRVREAIGVRLKGYTWPDRFLVASTPFEFAEVIRHLADVSYVADPERWYFLLRVPGVWRVMFPTRSDESDDEILQDEYIERQLQRVYPKRGRYEVSHRTLYAVHQRVASTYRVGRAFLAGDAAHLNNPLGGMGMNGGIHDAFNLAEQLVQVIGGNAETDRLDQYECDRRPVALEYVDKISAANKRNLEQQNPEEQRRWRDEMTNTASDPKRAREYLLKVSMIASLQRSGRR